MNFAPVINALALPPDARVDQRVPKKLLLEQGAPAAADKRQIQDGIEELFWVAALKPTNIAVPAFRDEVREYLEIAVLTAALRAGAKPTRLIELIHRAIPYPLVLVAAHGDTATLSLAHKRWSQGETGKVVIEDVHRTAPFRPDTPTAEEAPFLASLAVSSLPTRDLFCTLSRLARPRRRTGSGPDHRHVCPAGFSRPRIGPARGSRNPRPTSARPDCPPRSSGKGKATQSPRGTKP